MTSQTKILSSGVILFLTKYKVYAMTTKAQQIYKKHTTNALDFRIPAIENSFIPERLENFVKAIKTHRYVTPFMVTDLEAITTQCKLFRHALPDIKMYYAVKCFNDKEVIRHMDMLVDGFDISSVAEIKLLRSIDISPDRIVFSNPVKSEQSLAQASVLGVRRFAYQSTNELIKIKKHCKDAQVYLRIKVADSTSAISFSSKFGCEPEEAVKLLVSAKKLGLKPIGITFHVGSQATVSEVWDKAIRRCLGIIQELKKYDIELELLNLGGGFPVRYSDEDPTIDEVGKVINGAITKNLPAKHTLQLMAEPGRFLVADSSVIVTTIIGVEERAGVPWLFLDVGSFQAFIEIFEFGNFPYPVHSLDHLTGKLPVTTTQHYVLTGPSCDSYDTMSFNVELPTDLAIGNKLIIDMCGAYTIVYGSNFNGFKVPSRKYIKNILSKHK